jgi:hypothetical protein
MQNTDPTIGQVKLDLFLMPKTAQSSYQSDDRSAQQRRDYKRGDLFAGCRMVTASIYLSGTKG